MKKIKLVRIEGKTISTAKKYLKIINKYGRQVVLVSMYKNWQEDKGFILDELFSYYRTFISKLKEEIPFETLTESDLRVMGFGEWDNEKHLFSFLFSYGSTFLMEPKWYLSWVKSALKEKIRSTMTPEMDIWHIVLPLL